MLGLAKELASDLITCRVCGYHDDDWPYGEDGKTPSHNICPCCGVEHGYEDISLVAVLRYRGNWISGGGKWFSPRLRPAGWDMVRQLSLIPAQWLPTGETKARS